MQVVGRVWQSVQCRREMLSDRRNSNQCDSMTQETTHMSKVGGGKRGKIAVFD